ncbi:MAG: hypothetical protein ACI3W8_01295 [Oscillospiraceae bacterium]
MQNMDISTMNVDDAAVISLRKSGHFLHHSAGADKGRTNAELMAALTEEEKKTLTELLQKCLRSWETL